MTLFCFHHELLTVKFLVIKVSELLKTLVNRKLLLF